MSEPSDVLLIIAHPDDEIFVSGTLCLLSDRQFRIDLVCVTDGENGSRELLAHLPGRPELGAIRRRELELSAQALGIGKVARLGQPDVIPQQWGRSPGWDTRAVVSVLARTLEDMAPALVLTHGPRGGYGHPAHCEVHRCVMAAARQAAFCGSIFSFAGQVSGAFFSWHFDDPSDLLIDARSFLRRRVASLCYHQSQSEFFLHPQLPRTLRSGLSASFGMALSFTEAGRKRVPIGNPHRFFKRFPTEGLVLRSAVRSGQKHFFAEHYADDPRVAFASSAFPWFESYQA